MKRDILNLNFLSAVNEKIPNKTELANYLVTILHIEKEAVYRRLRAEVPFIFAEVTIISEKLGISLDKLIGIYSEGEQPFNLYLHDFETPSDSDLILINNYINVLGIVKRDPNSSINEVWNTLPFPLTYAYKSLTKFFILKWKYQFKPGTTFCKFNELTIPPKIKELQTKHLEEYKNIKYSCFILEHSIFEKAVEDIRFF
ncbi:MAG: hypothetical protein LUE98_10400 [Tannerellaceae bacterium]|nr:hypothetical protein [Tannerellaceae bacterium]